MHGLERFQTKAMAVAPVGEAENRALVALSRVRVADVGGEPLEQPSYAGIASLGEEGGDGGEADRADCEDGRRRVSHAYSQSAQPPGCPGHRRRELHRPTKTG